MVIKIQITNDKGVVTELSESDSANLINSLTLVTSALTEIQTISANSGIGPDQITQINGKAKSARDAMIKTVARAFGIKL